MARAPHAKSADGARGARDPVIEPVRAAFRAIAATVVPEAAHLQEHDWRELEDIVEDALSDRPAAMRAQLRLFVRALELVALLLHGHRFTRLDQQHRARVLHSASSARIALVRKGFWGLRTLIFMGYYGRAAAAADIGYEADPRGWEVRR